MVKEEDMKTMMKIFGLAILMSAFGHCNKNALFKDDELHLERESYTGDQLRIDGYYFNKLDHGYYEVNFFYRNGIVLHIGGGFSNINEIEDNISKEFIDNTSYQDDKLSWGVFKIDGANILFERWYPSQPPLKAYVKKGEILNDTTFKITESYRMKDGEKTERKERNETFHFKEFTPKPDSTNKFVE